jgi:pyruvate/2-oxoglutarate dehydrogenase complex dihydrolipoamide dehydrogenase (E3) component
VAVGRRPATDDLGLDEAGIETDDGGAIVVDDGYGTSTAGVYAVGDCTGGPQFTHASWDDHRILFDRLEGDGRRGRSDRIVPYTIFTDPQVARVGLDERRAREAGVPHVVASLPVAHVARARETGRLDGVLRILLDPASERILGASLVGDQAGELVHVLVVLMQAQASARALLDAEMVHPAWAEGLQSALTTLERYALD